jgi:predicted lipoprotein with Yx(FWY)xxD motif
MNAAARLHSLHAVVLLWDCRGRPLYAWIEEMKPGDRSGDGFDKTRSLARP